MTSNWVCSSSRRQLSQPPTGICDILIRREAQADLIAPGGLASPGHGSMDGQATKRAGHPTRQPPSPCTRLRVDRRSGPPGRTAGAKEPSNQSLAGALTSAESTCRFRRAGGRAGGGGGGGGPARLGLAESREGQGGG